MLESFPLNTSPLTEHPGQIWSRDTSWRWLTDCSLRREGGGSFMTKEFEIDDGFIAEQNQKAKAWIEEDYEHLGKTLLRRNLDAEQLVALAQAFRVAVPSWGVGTGGTRFARFPGLGEPRGIHEKLEDCGTIFKLVRSTP